MNKRKDVIKNNLKEYRIFRGYSQKQVAEKLGLTNTVSLSHWEKGINIPNILNLFKLSVIYSVNPIYLYAELYNSLTKESVQFESTNPSLINVDVTDFGYVGK